LKDNERIVSILDRIGGVGIWTGELTMIRGMQKWDTLPPDDLGLRRTISRYYCSDIRIPSDETCRIAQRWGNGKDLRHTT
jgi:DNA-3-methyladenine glycosylase II